MSENPAQIATEALKEATRTIECTVEDDIAALGAEEDALNELLDGLADAVEAGMERETCDKYIDKFYGKTSFTKTQVKNSLDDELDNRRIEQTNRQYTHMQIRNDCDLHVTRTTDHKQDTSYLWDFGDFAFDTSAANGQDHHLDERRMMKQILASSDVGPIHSGWSGDEWYDFISEYIENNATYHEADAGDRTTATNRLETYINNHEAYWPIEALSVYEGVFIPQDGGATDGNEDEVWVQNTIIVDICDEFDIQPAPALYNELNARGHLTDNDDISGATEEIWVGGQKLTFWVLDRDFCEPLDYHVNPDGHDDPETYYEESSDDLGVQTPGVDGEESDEPDSNDGGTTAGDDSVVLSSPDNGDDSEDCETLGCENKAIEDGLCTECLDVSPEDDDE